LGLFAFVDTVADPDLWGHVRFGRDILRSGAVARVDPYSYRTGGRPWMNHEWLAEVCFAAVYGPAGPAGLVALKAAAALLIVGACYRHLLRRGAGPLAALALLGVACAPLRMGLATVRPQMFTYLGFLVVLLSIEAAGRGRGRWTWAERGGRPGR